MESDQGFQETNGGWANIRRVECSGSGINTDPKMIAHPVTQQSEAWLKLRLGHPTASEFHNLVTPLWKIKTGDGPRTYLCEKLTERMTGKPIEDFGTWAMDRGTILEKEAIPFYEGVFDVKVTRMGYCTTDDMRIGCSPDGLIGEDGGMEVKCPLAQTHIRYLLDGVVPDKYLAQVHGSMFVTGRAYWNFMSYCRGLPPLTVRVERDEVIQAVLAKALTGFLAEMESALAKITQMKGSA